MTIIGFDVSKNELVGVRINKTAVVKESYIIENNVSAISDFLEKGAGQHPKLIVASEATAEYHRALALECLGRGIPFRLLNPIITKQFTRATIRKRKTDISDAFIIAKLALQGEGSLVSPEDFSSLKAVSRTARKLSRITQMLHLMQQRLVNIMPQELDVIGQLTMPRLQLEKSILNLRKRSRTMVDPELHALISSIPGIGETLATNFIVEIGAIKKFYSSRALIAFAGLDPKVRQSGLTLKRNTRLTKRGSPYLRRTAYIAASIAQRHDPELKEYFEKKIAEGKRYKEATVAVARKILYRVFAVWKRGTPYVKRPASVLSTAIA